LLIRRNRPERRTADARGRRSDRFVKRDEPRPEAHASRTDAIRDGVLIDVAATAGEAGFKYPGVLTAAAWANCVTVPPGVLCQDEAGRLWDVLAMLRLAIRGQDGSARELRFGVHVRNDDPEVGRLESEEAGQRTPGREHRGAAAQGEPPRTSHVLIGSAAGRR
jgi:hypothetical protein